MTISTEPNILRNKRRSSHRRYSIKKRVLENFANFTGIHWYKCICVNCENFSRTPPFLQNTYKWLFLSTEINVPSIGNSWAIKITQIKISANNVTISQVISINVGLRAFNNTLLFWMTFIIVTENFEIYPLTKMYRDFQRSQ